MEIFVKHYTMDLLPVVVELTARLVCFVLPYQGGQFLIMFQCQLYMRLVKDTVSNQPDEDDDTLVESVDYGDDKVYAAMGMTKTIQTVLIIHDRFWIAY